VVSSTPRPHFTPGKDPVPIVQEAGWAPSAGLDGRKISPPPGFDPRTVQPVAQSLYRLSYRAHNQTVRDFKFGGFCIVSHLASVVGSVMKTSVGGHSLQRKYNKPHIPSAL